MATSPQLGKSGKYGDLKKRLLFLAGALIVCPVAAHIPVPGIDPLKLAELFQGQQGGILGLFNMFSGGALSRFTIFALGIMPYISASIIMQLMTAVSPQLEALRKEGRAGQRKMTQSPRYGTLFLATFQATGISIALESQPGLVMDPGLLFRFTTVTTLVTGTMFLMWLGEQVTERGQQKTRANCAKRRVGNKVYGGQSSHLPFKLNMAGVIPPIFASSIILFPATVANWFTSDVASGSVVDLLGQGQVKGAISLAIKDLASTLSPGQPVYVMLYAAAIIFFCFFYTALQYNPKETADNLKKSGAFVPGIRPGEQTSRYLEKILLRLTLAGALYVTLVCLLPEFLILRWNVPFYFGGTSLLIIVVVTMDFMAQVQAYVMTHQYESLRKKASFKGGLPVR